MKKIILIILLLILFKNSYGQLCFNNIKEKSKPPIIFVENKNELINVQPNTEKIVSYLDSNIIYKFGGNKRFYLDCSSFVQRVFKELFNIDLPRTSKEMFRFGHMVDSIQTFDLVFFGIKNYVNHVGIYIGNNKFIHCSTKRNVILSDLNDKYYRKKFIQAKNIISIIENKQIILKS